MGCNWQPVGSPFVLGVEGEAGYMKLEGSAFDPLLIVANRFEVIAQPADGSTLADPKP